MDFTLYGQAAVGRTKDTKYGCTPDLYTINEHINSIKTLTN